MPPVKKPKAKAAKKEQEEVVSTPVVSGQLDKKLKKQVAKKQQKEARRRGVVFIKHLPHGFFEDQMKNYFSQFGRVTRVRLSRSKRTGGSKGFGFVEFDMPEVAQVAAETMNNYLMFNKVTKAAYIPPEEQRYNYFKTSVKKIANKIGKEKYVSNVTMNIQRKVKQQNDWSGEALQKRTDHNLQRLRKLNKKYAHLGIDFSKFAIEPKLSTEEAASEEPATKKAKKASPAAKAAGKEKTLTETVATLQKKQDKKAAKKKGKAADKSLQLEDLLSNTIPEDSGDEDYEPAEEDGTSDEEAYGLSKDSFAADSEEEEEEDEDDEESDEEEDLKPQVKQKAAGKKRFEQLLKRKPHAGAIQKPAKKSLKKQPTTIVAKTAKTALVAQAAKKAAKPLQNLKKGSKKVKK